VTETRTTASRGGRRGTLRVLQPPRLRLGLSTGALYPTPTEDVPDAAARVGLFDLEIMLQTPGEYGTGFIRELSTRCRNAGSRVHAVHLWQQLHPLLSPYARRAREGRTLFARAIDGAVELGAKVIVWHGPKQTEMRTPAAYPHFVDAATERGAACAAAGLRLAIENVSWCALASVRDVLAFSASMKELDPRAERVGFAFDPFQASVADANPFMLLSAMGDRVFDVHLSDRRHEDPEIRHLPPGEGDLPWPALLRAVSAVYSGPLMIEGVVGDDLARVDATRRLLDPVLRDILQESHTPCEANPPAGLLEGIRLFNEGEYYECHEAIEHEWHAETRPIRRLYQGILQIGVGLLHAQRGNHAGALLLLADGIEKTTEFSPVCLGIDTGRLAAESQAVLDRLRELGPDRLGEFDLATAPRVQFVTTNGPSCAAHETEGS
jgi:sugar phosphate isomerase/epimerase/predicted metal-dependent hydrolase